MGPWKGRVKTRFRVGGLNLAKMALFVNNNLGLDDFIT
jgi:hypothetical protein